MAVAVKRVYDPPSANDGLRVLIDRLWPRGLSKSAARIDIWARELSPSNELRKWYGHEAAKWPEFKRRYRAELNAQVDALKALASEGRRRKVTLLFGSKEPRLNNAYALKEFLQARVRRAGSVRPKPVRRNARDVA
jgi:uncharacterized protein YeaO (DUF488 family)